MTPPGRRRTARIAVAGMVLAGAVLRLWTMTTTLGVMDADEAVVGLMARDWLDGRAAVFYWGQNYSGSQESLLVAAAFAVFPSAPMAAKFVPAAMHALAAVLVWRIGRRVVGPRAAIVGGGLSWLWPASFVWWSLKVRGHYSTTLVLSLAAVLLALRLVDDPLDIRRRRVLSAAFGLAGGMAWWASFQMVFLVVPAGAWLVWRRGRSAAVDLAWAAPAAVAGSLPWLIWNVTHSFGSFRTTVGVTAPPYWDRVDAFLTDAFPKAIGATVPFSGEWAVPVVGPLLWAGVSAAIGLAAVAAVRARDRRLGLLVAVVAAYPFLFALSPFFYVAEPRYLYFLAPVLALLVARVVAADRFPPVIPLVAVGGAVALSAATLATMANAGVGLFYAGDVPVPRRLDPLIETLQAESIHHVLAPYAMAYRITLDSGGAVAASPIEQVRSRRLDAAARSPDRPAWVFMADSDRMIEFERVVVGRGARPGCVTTGDFAVCRPDRRFVQEDLPELQP